MAKQLWSSGFFGTADEVLAAMLQKSSAERNAVNLAQAVRHAELEAEEDFKQRGKSVLAKITKEQPLSGSWKMQIQAEASRLWMLLVAQDCSPTKNSIKSDLAKWCRGNGVVTERAVHPSADYIYRHVLRTWKPPIG